MGEIDTRKEAVMLRTSLRFLHLALVFLCSCLMLAIASERLAAQSSATPAQSSSALTVRVMGLRNAKGNVSLSLYRDSKFVETRILEIDARTLSAKTLFTSVPRGVYAVYLFHDENMNGEMDTNFFRMPMDGYGMSNNPRKRRGKPGFDETNFDVNEPQCLIEIKMIYW
ncbi:MAG: DUF2141 domain-containing protein [Terracidiphilus sp.]